MIRFTAQLASLDAAAPDAEAPRTITGIAVPWDVAATVSDGTPVKFLRGSFDVNAKPAKLIENHDMTQLRGTVTELVDAEEGLLFTARFAKTAAADEAIELVKAGAYDAVSVGAQPVKFKYDKEGTMVVSEARLLELSLVPYGAFEEAVITEIAASEPDEIPAPAEDAGNTDPQDTPKENEDMSDQTPELVEATIPTAPLPAQPKREFKMPSAADYLAAMHIGGDTFRKVNEAFVEAQKASRTVLQAAAGDEVTTNVPGLLPVPVLGPVFQDINYMRPFISAIGARAYPDGGSQKTFIRPTIDVHTQVAEQTNELGAGGARTMVIEDNVVQKKTFSGTVTISAQTMDFTSPAAMQQILTDLMGQYMITVDNFAVDSFVTASTTIGQWDGTPEDLILFLYGAARDISNGSNFFPTHILMGADAWAKLGSTVDDQNRPLFPMVGAPGLGGYNTLGAGNVTNWSTTNPLGLQIIVDSNVAAKTMVVFHAPAAEYYEQVRGLMSVEVPSKVAREFTYYGYASFFLAKSTFAQKITYA
jgi:HK97 family phage prohead protease